MSLQDMIVRLSNYGVRFRNYSGNFAIEIQFPKDWTIVNPENENVAFTNDDNNPGLCYYMCPINNDLSEVFDAINETIKYNEELKLKIELFKEKVVELQEIFAQEPYEKLKEMRFTIQQDKRKPGKSSKKTKECLYKDCVASENEIDHETNNPVIHDSGEHKLPECNKTSTTLMECEEDKTMPSAVEPEIPSDIDKKIMEAVKNKKKRKK